MKHQLYLKSLPPLATRRATRGELYQCGAGLVTCLAILVVSTVFMAADVVFPDTTFGSVLGFQTWQMVNYVMNALFAILAILISSNILSLYTAVQRFLLRPTSRSRGQIPAVALKKPGVAAAYNLFALRSDPSLAVVCLLAALVPILSAVSTFLLDFKLTTRNMTVCSTATNITTLFDNIDSMFAEDHMNGTAMGEWAAFSALILSTTVVNIPGPIAYLPHDFLVYAEHPFSGTGIVDGASIEFAGTMFDGLSSYGFSSIPGWLWGSARISSDGGGAFSSAEARMFSATTLQVMRLAPGQSTNFTCDTLPFTNFSTPVLVSPSGSAGAPSAVPSTFLYSVSTDGPCFTRNSTFVIGAAHGTSPSAQFDIQACHTDSDLQIQFVVVNLGSGDPTTNYTVEAYNCSSQIFEVPVYGIQTSYSDMTMLPSSEEGNTATVSSSDLQRYAAHLNTYFGLATYPISNDTVPEISGSARSQGDWTSVLRHSWIPSPHGPTYWPSHEFVNAYADALVPSLGTYLATMYMNDIAASSLWLSDHCAVYDTLEKQVLKLGTPAKAGAPLLIIILALLLAHVALLWLYTKELPMLQTDDSMEMLLKVNMRGYGEEKVAELVPEGESESEMRGLSEVRLLSYGDEGEDAKRHAEMGRDEDGAQGKW